ncbi:nucleotidyltransferase domain-containing protein [Algirhabdus cladophorae]|uniref:nucleotidyltransferase domain-containing protein n=1 Tax=Algirhabdus cladophorae TaxID=3377108 RepID=UPI003B84A40E
MPQTLDPNAVPWHAWTPWKLQQHLAGQNRLWYVVGGWALDLWHGHQTREHEDLEFCILRPDFDHFRKGLASHDLFAATNGQLAFHPVDQPAAPQIHQFWGYDPTRSAWHFDMMIEPGTPQTWIYKRDTAIAANRSQMINLSPDGIKYLNPAAVLLFKAKHTRPKDVADFNLAVPNLRKSEVTWLKDTLTRLHPNHPWISQIEGAYL